MAWLPLIRFAASETKLFGRAVKYAAIAAPATANQGTNTLQRGILDREEEGGDPDFPARVGCFDAFEAFTGTA